MSDPRGNQPNPGVLLQVAGEVGSNPYKMTPADKAYQAADLKWQSDLAALKAVASS